MVLPHPRSLQLTTRSNSSPSQAPGKSTVYSRKPCVCWVPIKCIHCYYCSATQSCLILRSHALQHSRPPCPSLCPRVCLKFISFELVMPSNHLILCCPLFLLPSNMASTGIQIQVKGDLFIEKVPILQSPTYSQKNLPCWEGGPLTILLGLRVPPGRGKGERRGSIQGGVRAHGLGGSVCTSLPGLGFRECDRRVGENTGENPVYPFPPGQHIWGPQDPVILSRTALCSNPYVTSHQPAQPPSARPEALPLLLHL